MGNQAQALQAAARSLQQQAQASELGLHGVRETCERAYEVLSAHDKFLLCCDVIGEEAVTRMKQAGLRNVPVGALAAYVQHKLPQYRSVKIPDRWMENVEKGLVADVTPEM